MTNATKTLTVIFVSLLVITGLVKWIGSPSSSRAFQSRLVEVDTAAVNRMVIESLTQDRTVTLSREETSWKVTGDAAGDSYPADDGSIQRAIEQLNGLNVKSVATRDPEKYTRFKVDSTGTKVSLYNNNDLLSSIIIGAPQVVGRREFNSYVRPVDDKAVYAVEGFLSSTFNRDVEDWRDKVVWDVERDKISRIDFMFPADSSYSVERAGENNWISREDTLKQYEISSILNRLSTLRASGFVDSLSAGNFGTELYAIQLLLDNGVQKTLRLKLPGEEATNFHAVASDYAYLFTLDKSVFENSVLKSREELLKE